MILQSGNADLSYLIENMEPYLHPHAYVITSVPDTTPIHRKDIIMFLKEKEGITLILEQSIADHHDVSYRQVFAMITLNVNSSLEAVGFTAAFSNALAKENINCNVVAGYHHDHIFVDYKDGEKAINCLKNFSGNPSS